VNLYVPDASVAAKWFLPETQERLVPEARRILEGYAEGSIGLLVPDLFWAEIGNICWKAVRIGRMSRSAAEEALANLAGQGFRTSPSMPLLEDAFAIASDFKRTVYDAIYVALAVASNRIFVTADERLANALAAYFPVRWLGSL
jgi:predicted nucleic acid-binding protein